MAGRGIENIHERVLTAPPAAVGALLDSLSSREGRLWPNRPSADVAIARHTLEGHPRNWLRLGWPLCFRWLHDALIEDAFDRAEAELAGVEWRPRELPAHVRALRWLAARL